MSDAMQRRVEEILDDIDTFEDYAVADTNDPEVIDIIIRGRLKKDLKQKYKNQDPVDDYDRAMKGIDP